LWSKDIKILRCGFISYENLKNKNQFQGLGESVSDSELIINALPPNWNGFASGIYSRKGTPMFDEIWALYVLEETRLKAKDDTEPHNEISQEFATKSKKFGLFGIFGAHHRYNKNKPHGN